MTINFFKPQVTDYELLNPETGESITDTTVETVAETGEEKHTTVLRPVKLKMIGPDSTPVKTAFRNYVKSLASVKAQPTNLEMADEVMIVKAAAAVVGWDANGDWFFGAPYSPDLVDKLLRDDDNRWLLEQVAAFGVNRANFFRKAP